MQPYRSFAAIAALAVLAACNGGAPPHPEGWPQVAPHVWAAVSGAGPERYRYTSYSTTGSLPDLASSQAVVTVQRYHGARLLSSKPFAPCPGEAGLATYSLPKDRLLEVAFSVFNGSAVLIYYERPKGIGESPDAVAAMRQSVCFSS